MNPPIRATALFPLGTIAITPAAIGALLFLDIIRALGRHSRGDWGQVCEEDRVANDQALNVGTRLLSVYEGTNGIRFWIITEGDRSATTILLPNDY